MLNGMYDNINFYGKALNGTWERNKAISHNIANENTPKFKRSVVSFEDQLKASLEKNNKKVELNTTHEKHIGKAKDDFRPLTMVDKSMSYRLDGNNVNIDTETADLAKNSIMYDALTKQITGEFEKIKNVIAEGSK